MLCRQCFTQMNVKHNGAFLALQLLKIVGLVERIDNRPSQLSSISERFYFKLISEKHSVASRWRLHIKRKKQNRKTKCSKR